MQISRLLVACCVLGIFAELMPWGGNARAAEAPSADVEQNVKEMPVLTGTVWQKMTPDEKIAFVWGIGHVVTIELQAAKLYPGLAQNGLAAKLAEGLAGMSMNDVVQGIDGYYKANPDDLETPAMEVIWVEMVKPKLKTGIAGLPLT